MMVANTISPVYVQRLKRCHRIAAECAARNPLLLPIFERMEREVSAAEIGLIKDPIEKARRMAEHKRALEREKERA
ncbi:hypothetical protein [Paracoccus sp. (in: a-proteobacteria)]|uniref:hypothetical protein n=1 Tax=Paracoccus sp. TaxID=267 RepID=UPI003A8A5065